MIINVPEGATVMRVYDNGIDSRCIVFEDGNPADYIWYTWSGSNWKSIDWMAGKVDDNNNVIPLEDWQQPYAERVPKGAK